MGAREREKEREREKGQWRARQGWLHHARPFEPSIKSNFWKIS
jgi:hypothetical protein